MGDFGQDWLSLREPADGRARSGALVERLGAWLSGQSQPRGRAAAPLGILDLGCGTGSNLRYLAPRLARSLGGPQRWICLDRDEALLAALPRRTRTWAASLGVDCSTRGEWLRVQGPGGPWDIRPRVLDLAAGLAPDLVDGGPLVTASALLDLVSDAWLWGLLSSCARSSAPLLLALTYDGRVELDPADPLDAVVIGLVNAHQRRDKGLGPALGPAAAGRLVQLAGPLGFSLALDQADWLLDAEAARLQAALVESWIGAALEAAGEQAQGTYGRAEAALVGSLAQWRQVRRGQIAKACLHIRVGHQDALLLPGPHSSTLRG